MPEPKLRFSPPVFVLGHPNTCRIRGKNLGGVGSHVLVNLSSDDNFTWNPSSADGIVIHPTVVEFTSTPSATVIPASLIVAIGIGDLTVTVTVTDSVTTTTTVSKAQSQDVIYCNN